LFSASLVIYYRGHVNVKHQYTHHVLKRTKLSKIEYRSLILYGIPQEIRHEVDLAAYMEGLGLGSVENVVICRKWSKLRHAVKNRFYCLQQLERIYHEVKTNKGKRYKGPRVAQPHMNGGADSNSNGNDHDEERNDAQNISSSEPLLSQRRFSISEATDPSLFEIMNYLDAVDPRKRPCHRVGFLGWMGEMVDSADYYAEKYKYWDDKVHYLRRMPEKSPATSVAIVTFDSPESAVCVFRNVLLEIGRNKELSIFTNDLCRPLHLKSFFTNSLLPAWPVWRPNLVMCTGPTYPPPSPTPPSKSCGA
jgi:hypothetical protein